MNPSDPKEMIVDALLEEVLGGQTPPDLSGRILEGLEAGTTQVFNPHINGNGHHQGNGNGKSGHAPLLPPVATPPVASPPVSAPPVQQPTAKPVVNAAPRLRERCRPNSNWAGVVVAASILLVGCAVGFFALKLGNLGGPNDASFAENDKPSDTNAIENSVPIENKENKSNKEHDHSSSIAKKDGGFNAPFAHRKKVGPAEFDPQMRSKEVDPLPDEEVIAKIDAELRAQWTEHKVTPVKAASDEQWCRRAYVRLVGRIPTVDELDRFVQSKSEDKQSALVDSLLASEEYAAHWSTIWANVLIGRFEGRGKGDLASRDGLEQYLQESLAEEKPYDQIAFELLTATGSGRPESEDFNGAANYILAGMADDTKQVTSHTARVFLGKNLRCVECHDHHQSGSEQKEFWQLHAFFQQVAVENKRRKGARLVAQSAKEDEVFYSDPNGILKAALPVLPDGTPIPSDGALAEVDRRAELAKWIVQSDELSRAAVNRIWAHFFRFGFTKQIDDMGPHSPASHPDLLNHLSEQFVAHDYSLSSLTRWISLSEVFSLSSEMPNGDVVDAPELGGRALFSRYYMRPMDPEEVINSLKAIADGKGSVKIPNLGVFATKSSKSNGKIDPHLKIDDTPPLLPKGPLTQQFSNEHASFLDRVAGSKMSDREKVEHLFLTALSRKPRKSEREMSKRLFKDNTNGREVLESIWWALINSTEFHSDH